jgi:sterol 3beta-glucosyltransferase
MKAFILTYGSRGEFQPFLAVAKAFVAAGHTVRLGAPPNPGFSELAAEHGIPFIPIGTPWRAEDVRQIQTRSFVGDPVKMMRIVVEELMLKGIEEAYGKCLDAGDWSDVILSHFGQPVGRMAAETLGRPFVTGMLEPALPTRCWPPPAWRSLGGRLNPLLGDWLNPILGGRLIPFLGRWLNLRLWRAASAKLDRAFASSVNTARARVGMAPLTHPGSDGLYSPDLNLVAVSPLVAPPADDWAPRHRMTGYWFMGIGDWKPSLELAEFVSRDPKTIAITLGLVPGTQPGRESDRLTKLVVEAVKLSGVRAVIEPGGLNLGGGRLPSSILRCTAPHSWLFERVAAVVHHGGAGTTAAAFRAGVPSVVVPKAWDQPFWAQKAESLGVAPAPVPRGELTVTRLADAIVAATSDPGMRRRAVRLGEAICQEDGAGVAVNLVQRLVGLDDQQAADSARPS